MSSHYQYQQPEQHFTSSSSSHDGHDKDVSTAIQRHLDIESGGDNPINDFPTHINIDLSSRSMDSYFTTINKDELKSQLFHTQTQSYSKTDQCSIAGASLQRDLPKHWNEVLHVYNEDVSQDEEEQVDVEQVAAMIPPRRIKRTPRSDSTLRESDKAYKALMATISNDPTYLVEGSEDDVESGKMNASRTRNACSSESSSSSLTSSRLVVSRCICFMTIVLAVFSVLTILCLFADGSDDQWTWLNKLNYIKW